MLYGWAVLICARAATCCLRRNIHSADFQEGCGIVAALSGSKIRFLYVLRLLGVCRKSRIFFDGRLVVVFFSCSFLSFSCFC